MKAKKKYSIVEIIMVIFCSLGCLLIVAPKFVETELNLFTIAIALNGVGIMAFLYSQNQIKLIRQN
jgi:hypothetical protein